MNNNESTHRFASEFNGEHSESIIDLFIISGDLIDKTVSFRVNNKLNYFGHFPITTSFDIPASRVVNKTEVYYTKATNWDLFKNTANNLICSYFDNNFNPKDGPKTIENYYEKLGKVIKESDKISTVVKSRNNNHRTLPNHVLSIIEAR